MEEKIVLDADKKYALELLGEQLVLIINSITKLPYAEVSTTMASIQEQLTKK